jgi:hypothetical protein
MKKAAIEHGRIKTDDADFLTAFATLGVPFRISAQVEEKSGREAVRFYMGEESISQPGIQTGHLLRLLKDGKLEAQDGQHPLLFALAGIKNWHALKSGQPCVLVRCSLAQRCVYIREAMLPAGCIVIPFVDSPAAIPITSLDFVAAAGTCGLPAIRTADGFRIADKAPSPFEDTYAALRYLEGSQMSEEHGFCYARRAIQHRQKINERIAKARRMIWVTRRGSQRAAHVQEDITNDGLDIMRKFLNGGRP